MSTMDARSGKSSNDRTPVPLDTLLLRDWTPTSQVRTTVTAVERPAVPCIDIHNHLGRWLSDDGGWIVPDVDALLALLDAHDVETVVNLDGRWGRELTENLERYDLAHSGRFVTFCQFDWSALQEDDAAARLARQLKDAVDRGARGVKVWKDLGLRWRAASGELVLPDDPVVVELLGAAGEAGLPVLIHTADPVAFFEPLDSNNERIDELGERPDWWFGGPEHPPFHRLIDALENLVSRTPGTTYVGAHVGCYAEDLGWVDRMLSTYPNFHVDTGGRIGELGRVPRSFRRLVAAHPDRVLFGTDSYPPDATAYELAFRFFETDDEAFGYAPGCDIPPQGRWDVAAANLPPSVLPAFYADNARRILGI
jgi:predicted TIM-barrel fold metal-dependent hydrolase